LAQLQIKGFVVISLRKLHLSTYSNFLNNKHKFAFWIPVIQYNFLKQNGTSEKYLKKKVGVYNIEYSQETRTLFMQAFV